MEVTGGIVRSENVGTRWGVGDRIVFFRFKILSEKRSLPGVVLGLHDPLGFIGEERAQHFNASYLVASKGFHLTNTTKLNFHAGYGVDWIPAAQYQFVGFFGGIEFISLPSSSFMVEYDADKFNAKLRVDFFKNFQGTVGLFGLDKFGGGISYRMTL